MIWVMVLTVFAVVIAWALHLIGKKQKQSISELAVDISPRLRASMVANDAIKPFLCDLVERYSRTRDRDWENKKQAIFADAVLPRLREGGLSEIYPFEDFSRLVDYEVHRRRKKVLPKPPTRPLTPIDFEDQCAKKLQGLGWDARTTVAAGDQGADIIASKNGDVVVIQCKLYSRPVGNKAVQEVHAALSYYRANRAAVVTNATYTSGAHDLAARTGVVLLRDHQLDQL